MVLTTAQGRGGVFHRRRNRGFASNIRYGLFTSGRFLWYVLGGSLSDEDKKKIMFWHMVLKGLSMWICGMDRLFFYVIGRDVKIVTCSLLRFTTTKPFDGMISSALRRGMSLRRAVPALGFL
jgi:hypothetical protein